MITKITKTLFLIVIFFSAIINADGQLASGIPFSFAPSATAVAFPGAPVNILLTTRPPALRDEFDTLITPVAGLAFNFAGTVYTKFIVSSNGWLALTNTALIPASIPNPLPNNSLSTYTGGLPLIAPLWDDDTCSLIQYTCVANVLTVRWTVKWEKTNAAAASAIFWAELNGNTGTITFDYANLAYTPSAAASASIGIAGICTGDFYSVTPNATITSSTIDSVTENSSVNLRPQNSKIVFTPYSPNDNCASATDLGTINTTCNYITSSTFNATTSGSAICATTDVKDVWFRFVKPAGMNNVKITTAPAACQSVSGTSIDVYSVCGGASLGCATTSVANPNYGEITVSTPCAAETLWVRVTADSDVPGKFKICAKDGGVSSTTGATCANSTPICGLPFTQTGLSTAGFGADYDSANSVCHDPFMNGEDYLFSYTPTTNICVRISMNSTGSNPGVFVFDGCPNLLASTHCIASAENATGNCTINSVSLVAGTTYYFLVDNDTLGAALYNIPFDISITSVGTSQAYDACGATNLGTINNNQSCVFTTYTTECSTPSTFAYPNPGCGSLTNGITGDIWLTFTAGFSGSILLKTQPGAVNPATDIAMAVYTGNCITLTLFACDDNSAGNGMPLLSIPVAVGTTYYIRLWTVAPGNTGSFDFCMSSACSPPNDLPCAAVFVNLGGIANGINTCAGSASEPPNAAQCVAGGIINNVWYKAVVPASGQMKIRTHTHSLTDTQIEAFRFPTGCANAATSFISKGCNDDGPDCGSQGNQSYHDFSELILTGLTPGDTIYIAVDGMNSQTGTFDITIIDGTSAYPPVPGADCDAANIVCGPNDIVVPDPGILGYGNICDFQPSLGCWPIGERNSAWYNVTVNPGTLQFDVQTLSDYDFIMWDITGIANACAQIQNLTLLPIRCDYTTTVGHTGITSSPLSGGWQSSITSATTRTYLILIDNWNPPFSITGYTLTWMGSPISSATTAVSWQGAVDTSYTTINNWGTPPCNAVPTCGIDATIATSSTGRQPTISSNVSVRNLTINTGATLRIKSPSILDICGNFTNNGNLIAEPGSTIRFSGTANVNQTITGNLTGVNSFANLVIDKPASSGNVTLNSNIDVSQNFLINTSTSIFNINGKYMKVAGNFTNNSGTNTFTGITGSTVEFNGITNQNFINVNLPVMDFSSVKMNKATGKLYLNGANSIMNVDSILTLLLGNIVTTTTLEVNIKFASPTAITSHNANSYIDGRLRRKTVNVPLGGSNDFPVGDSLVPNQGANKGYELANISFTSSTIVTDLLVWFNIWPSTPPPNGPAGPDFCTNYTANYSASPLFDNGYWAFQRSSAAFNGTYNVTLYNTGGTNTAGGTTWTVAKADIAALPMVPASWSLLGTCNPASTATVTKRNQFNSPVAPLGASSFNHLYATAQAATVLPVELLYFTAEPQGEEVLCKWETASEINNDYFDVERSKDGTDFESIGRVRGFGQGISTEPRSYSLIDHDLCTDIRYYRLKQVDIDGAFSYSDAVAINCGDNKNLINVYPNPAKAGIFCSFYETKSGAVKLQWLDVIGKIVKEDLHPVIKGYNTVQSDVSDLADGIYYLRIKETGDSADDNDRRVKFLKN